MAEVKAFSPSEASEHIARAEYLSVDDYKLNYSIRRLEALLPPDATKRLTDNALLVHLKTDAPQSSSQIVRLYAQVFASGDLSAASIARNMQVSALSAQETQYMQKVLRTLGMCTTAVIKDDGVPGRKGILFNIGATDPTPGPFKELMKSLPRGDKVGYRLSEILVNAHKNKSSAFSDWKTEQTDQYSNNQGNLDADVKIMLREMMVHEARGHQAFGVHRALVTLHAQLQQKKGESQTIQLVESYMRRMLQLAFDPVIGQTRESTTASERFVVTHEVVPSPMMMFTYEPVFKPKESAEFRELIGEEKLPMDAVHKRFKEIFLQPHVTTEDWKRLFHMEGVDIDEKQKHRLSSWVRLAEAVILSGMDEVRDSDDSDPVDTSQLPIALPGSGMQTVVEKPKQTGPATYHDFLKTLRDADYFSVMLFLAHPPHSMDDFEVDKDGQINKHATKNFRELFDAMLENLQKLEGDGCYDMCGVAQQLLKLYESKTIPYVTQMRNREYIIPYMMRLAVSLVDDPAIFGRVFPDYFPDAS